MYNAGRKHIRLNLNSELSKSMGMSSDIYTNLNIRKTLQSDTIRIGDATVSRSVSGDASVSYDAEAS
jgi:hypothetical protein